jgi:hypothetical protein
MGNNIPCRGLEPRGWLSINNVLAASVSPSRMQARSKLAAAGAPTVARETIVMQWLFLGNAEFSEITAITCWRLCVAQEMAIFQTGFFCRVSDYLAVHRRIIFFEMAV